MNTTTLESSTTAQPGSVGAATSNDPNRCPYRYSNGKRCRLPGSKSHFGLCSLHFSQSNPGVSPYQNDFEDLSVELLGETSEFESALDINKFLAKLLVLITKGRVTPRRASVLAYITNQLLHSHRAIDRENVLQREADGPPRFNWSDWPNSVSVVNPGDPPRSMSDRSERPVPPSREEHRSEDRPLRDEKSHRS